MDVTMETSPAIPSLSQSLPASPTGSRKRSFQEIDDAPTEKPSDGEKQDNHAPREHGPPTSVNPSTKTSTSESNQPGTIVDGPAKSAALDNVTPAAVDATKETTAVGSVLTMPTPSATTPAAPSTPERSAATSTAAGPNKRRKLSPASKEAKRLEKEAKERQKMEEKAKKEEEKRAKEEEKRKREAEREEERKKREEKRKIKEEEKAAKEEEKRKKEEEKLKKERVSRFGFLGTKETWTVSGCDADFFQSQMRLNAFFMKPAAPASTQSSSANASSSAGDGAGSNAPGNESAQKVISDYEREFPEFFVQSHTKLAPQHRFERDSEALEHIREKIDGWLKSGDSTMPDPPAFRPSELFRIMPYKRRRGRNVVPVREILLKLQNYYNTIDLTADGKAKKKEESNPLEMLKKVPMKILKYYEDVRPPYQGTFTKRLPESTALKLCRNPFHRGLPETNYDYDSEAEWEEPEEGEDLDSEGEEEISEDDDDDMEGFLDDDDDNQADGKRRLIVGDLEPVCSGIRWEENGVDAEFNSYRIEVISGMIHWVLSLQLCLTGYHRYGQFPH